MDAAMGDYRLTGKPTGPQSSQQELRVQVMKKCWFVLKMGSYEEQQHTSGVESAFPQRKVTQIYNIFHQRKYTLLFNEWDLIDI